MAIARCISGIILISVIFINQPEILAQSLQGVSGHAISDTPKPTHQNDISLLLRKTDDYKNIKRKIEHQKRKLKRKLRTPFSTGDTTSFYVRNILTLNTWNTVSAECIYISDKVALWVGEDDKAFYSDSLNITEIADSLSYRLESASHSGSVDPSKGIMSLNTEYFGSIPDIDGDGILDILLLDIEDNFSETGGFVAGFFDPVDLIEHEFSNQRDLLYIDLYPTLFYRGETNIKRAASTIAHEFQHIIHANYETPERQYTFINEGLSEYAEVLNGFSPRSPASYYQQPNRALFSWDYTDPIPDYARGSLFFTYLFEQIGSDKIKHLVQNRTDIGYQSVSDFVKEHSNRTFEELFRDWGLTLLGADEGSFGFSHPSLQNIRPTTARVNSILPSTSNISSPPLSHSFLYSSLSRELELLSNRHITASAWAEYPSGRSGSLQAGGSHFFAEDEAHGSLWMLFSNTEPQFSEPDTTSEIQSVLFTGQKSGQVAELAYDDGIPDAFTGNASFLQLGDHQAEIAVLFSADSEFWLSELTIKTIFSSELSGSGVPAQSTRDITVQIYSVKDNAPDEPLTPAFTHEFTRPFGNLKFERIPLAPFYEQLSSLTDSIAIVIKNDPDDENYLAVGMDYSGRNHALKGNSDDSWIGFEQVSVGSAYLSGWNPMIRATTITNEIEKESITPDIQLTDSELMLAFNTPEEIDSIYSRSVALTPSGVAIEGTPDYSQTSFGEVRYRFPIQVGGAYTIVSSLQGTSGVQYESRQQWSVPESADFRIGNNYPNPFNPATTIPFLLLEDGQVGVTVYDILGRKVLSVPERYYAAGNQTIQLDFAGTASGMYILKMDVNRPDGRGAITRIRKVTFVK